MGITLMKHRNFFLLAVTGVFVAYSATTCVALGLDLPRSLLAGTANTIPIVIFGMGVSSIVARLIAKPLPIQLTAHLLLCAVFCALSYCLLIVLFGLFYSSGPDGFVLRPFSVSGTAWQSLQNVTTYALIAALVYLRAPNNAQLAGVFDETGDEAVTIPALRAEAKAEAGSDAGLSRYFVRMGEELRPLDVDMVVSINGADDYAEVSTTTGKHLVRMTLASFAKSLDPSKYVRVHRSWIVNTHRVTRAEPAGGARLLLHMETGQIISTSRNGARLFRNRVL
jgi:DNA-binding LytR/AlgR family response regulator